jgi:orotate phosphoribosyltransferase
LIEDLVSTGGSSIRAVRALEEEGATVPLVTAIFSYGLPAADEAFAKVSARLFTLSGFDVLRTTAEREGLISQREADSIDVWRRDPAAWSGEVE